MFRILVNRNNLFLRFNRLIDIKKSYLVSRSSQFDTSVTSPCYIDEPAVSEKAHQLSDNNRIGFYTGSDEITGYLKLVLKDDNTE